MDYDRPVADYQREFLEAVGQAHKYQICHETGELSGGPFLVYKLKADGPWCFKSEVPITADDARQVAIYLSRLGKKFPDFAGPVPGYDAGAESIQQGGQA